MVTVFGLGFVGLTTALGFAHLGYKVYGVDVDAERKNTLRSGKLPFLEPKMEDVLNEHLNKNFFVTDDVSEAIKDSSYVFYCVGTPYGQNGQADLTYLFSAIDTTVEAIAANHMGMKVCGISCVCNPGAGLSAEPLTHEEVQAAADAASAKFKVLVKESVLEFKKFL